jgi:DNA replication protein DnaC
LQLPARYALATLSPNLKDTYPASLYDVAWAYLRQWPVYSQRGMGPVFVGPTGVGTSWTAAALVNEITMRSDGIQDVNCFWLSTFWKLRLMLESRDAKSYETYLTQRSNAFRHQLVVVDELLGAKYVEGGVAWIHALYNARYDAGLPTITTITTDNLDQFWRQVQNVFGKTFTDRLQATSQNLVGTSNLT